jgi:hypothetical protein
MNSHPVQLLEPVFHFLDRMIYEYGDVLYMVLVYLAIPLIVWILTGGLRRKSARQTSGITVPIIVIRSQSPASPPPLPPVIGESPERGQWPSDDDDSSSFAA